MVCLGDKSQTFVPICPDALLETTAGTYVCIDLDVWRACCRRSQKKEGDDYYEHSLKKLERRHMETLSWKSMLSSDSEGKVGKLAGRGLLEFGEGYDEDEEGDEDDDEARRLAELEALRLLEEQARRAKRRLNYMLEIEVTSKFKPAPRCKNK